ncbi:class F sortase [Nakamurella lactea]|uniref:class F sortase n=1 Tax=Nakamurella lactea TaxID=459515 RepID=UPI001FE1D2C7|nr:class F sortase [Nakamurella lactea]
MMGAVLVAATAMMLMLSGLQSTPPADAPVPSRTFTSTVPPEKLLPGDTIPPATGDVVAPVGGDVPSTGPADDRAGTPRIVAGGPDRPPRHAGPWTFDGPDRLFIRSLDVEAPIEDVGAEHGAMVIPDVISRVGRWNGGAALTGTAGTVLIAGHVNIAGQGLGALYRLSEIQPGAVVVTTGDTGRRSSWRVTSLESVNKRALPDDIFDGAGPRRLVLVTCGGKLLHIDGPHGGYNTYENNIVVRAVPA